MALFKALFEVLCRNLLIGEHIAGEPWSFWGGTTDK